MTREGEEHWHVLYACEHWQDAYVPDNTGPPIHAGIYVQCPVCGHRAKCRAVYLVPDR